MGDTIWFMGTMTAVAWLCLWVVRTPTGRSIRWSPFDSLQDVSPALKIQRPMRHGQVRQSQP